MPAKAMRIAASPTIGALESAAAPQRQAAAARSVGGEPLLIDASELARLLAISRSTVWRLVTSGKLPAPLRLGGSVRWRRTDIEGFLETLAEGARP